MSIQGIYRNSTLEYTFHSNDTLWDGEDCHSSSSCCSLHNPPYFTKSLGQSTTDDLELRRCHYPPIQYSNKNTWKVHNPRSHYNYLRIVNVEKYTVFQYCVIS